MSSPKSRRTDLGIASRWGRRVFDFVLPTACAGCAGYLPSSGPPGRAPRICWECRSRLRPAPHPRCPRCHAPRGTGLAQDRPCAECREWPDALVGARSAFLMRSPADALVHALKYGGWPELAGELAAWMIRLVEEEPELLGGRTIVPVPTTRKRLRARGYNQARMLADAVCRGLGETLVDALQRREGGGSQVVLHPGERRANVVGAFSVSYRRDVSKAIRDRDLLLVDDVLTTGATAGSAAEALRDGGARSVVVLTFARALPT